ncbi:Lsr2 family protein [Micromonospora noduli]|uniref:Lsr2 DNA-binding domain-containing protein n=1 Tax=Micromonospora noduli TaxID=709876 RepID=A0A328NC38_9ACTN|nr:Lsr2 family protein [Micromonospora noduli]RAO03083.1 hypothetical protein LAH08_02093 [Micromonospora noduli]
MNTTTMTPTNGTDRAALMRAAKGTPTTPAQRVPMGIRVTAGPGAPVAPAPTVVELPPVEVQRTMEELLRVAAGSEAVRTRKLAEKITGLVAELTTRVDAEEALRREREAAEARRRELAEAEAELANKLAEVRQKLRATGGDSAASVSYGRDESATKRAAIRQWALANGYEVRDRGRISRQIREAYAAATGSEVTQ